MATQAFDTSKGPAFRLKDLPAELQLRIFEYAVTAKDPVCINYGAFRFHTIHQGEDEDDDDFDWEAFRAQRTPAALTRVNKSIRHDTLKMYYRNNDFIVGLCTCFPYAPIDSESCKIWLRAIGVQNCKLMRSLLIIDFLSFGSGAVGEGCVQETKVGGGLQAILGAYSLEVGEQPGSHLIKFGEAMPDAAQEESQ